MRVRVRIGVTVVVGDVYRIRVSGYGACEGGEVKGTIAIRPRVGVGIAVREGEEEGRDREKGSRTGMSRREGGDRVKGRETWIGIGVGVSMLMRDVCSAFH